MRSLRLALVLLVALGLAPGTFVRSPDTRDWTEPVRLERLALPTFRSGPFRLEAGWQLTSANTAFGGWSALVAPPGELLLGSDRGALMRLARVDGSVAEPRLIEFLHQRQGPKYLSDLEALAIGPGDGRVWAAFENANRILRLSPVLSIEKAAQPTAMRNWSKRGGPESMTRLPDGRFLLLAEDPSDESGQGHSGLLYPGDPTEAGSVPMAFEFSGLTGFRPTDLAALPDGRVLILMRRVEFGLPPRFEGAILLADPAAIRPGETWSGQLVARLRPPFPTDNYEGLAVTVDGRGARHIWLVSDDNFMRYQRTLLIRFRWEKRRPPGA